MRYSMKISALLLSSTSLLLAGCPKSKTDTSNARTEMTQISVPTTAPQQTDQSSANAKPVAKDPVPAEKTKVNTQAGVTKKPEKSQKGQDLAVSSTHLEVVKPANPDTPSLSKRHR